jgi:Ca2+-binding EF-hand superfamily protein
MDTIASNSNQASGFFGKGRRMRLFNGVRNVAGATKALSQTTTRKAQIALWEREMKTRKQEFGVPLFDVMERNRNIGENSGGEVEPAVVEVFLDVVTDIMLLLERRRKKQAALIKTSNPKALCYQSAGEPTISEEEEDRSMAKEESDRGMAKYESSKSLNKENSNRSMMSDDSTASNNSARAEAFKQSMQRGLLSARNTVQASQNKVKLKSELAALDREIYQCKQKFGISMFDTMDSRGADFEPRDPTVRELFESAKKDVFVPLSKIIKAGKEINDVRATGSILVSHSEIREYVETNPFLWAMLGVNIGIPEERCIEVASRVVIELASGMQGEEAKKANITKHQFQLFQKKYVDDPKGSQEFFHRSVYDAFDLDGNGVLDKQETDKFLDTFYMTGSIFEGDDRLPEKEELKKLILEKLDVNGDGEFSFDEIRSLISGSAHRGDLLE